MPTYEYQCKKCHYTFEKFQPITAEPIQHCPKCHGEVKRLISKNGSFILKGSGFYSTDNRKSNLPKTRKSNDKQTSESTVKKGKKEKVSNHPKQSSLTEKKETAKT